MLPKKPKIAIVYDWLDKWGGVERVLLVFHKMFPEADFFTSYYDKDGATWANGLNISTSFIQQFPKSMRGSRIASFQFYPYAFESLNFSNYGLVISITSSFAKAVITKPGTKHICYLLTPTRYLWVCPESYFENKVVHWLLKPYINQIKNWDYIAAQRPDKIISISQTVADRCQRYYQRESKVIYPPFDTEYWENIKLKIKSEKSKTQVKNQKFFLIVSRLEPYKKVDLVVQSFKQLDQDLIIVGEGSQEGKLKQIAGNNIYFYKKLSDEELGWLYSKAQALIMPQEEDFGYVSLEAQFFGCPIIAYKKGGAIETVIEEKTGIFFEQQSEQSFRSALERFNKISYNLRCMTKKLGQDNIRKFDIKEFIRNIKKEI